MKRLNPETGKEFQCGDTREQDPKGKGRLLFRGYLTKLNASGFYYEIWETPEKFWGRAKERKDYITKYTLDPINRAKFIWNRTKDGARRRKIGFHITTEDVMPALKRGVCELTGLPFCLDKPNNGASTHPYAPSIDRIDSNKEYTKDNIRIVLWAVNAATNQFTDKEMLPILKAMVRAMENNANEKPTTPIPAGSNQQGEVYPELGSILTTWLREDHYNTHNHSGADAGQDADHSAQKSSGDSMGRRGQEVGPSTAPTCIKDHGIAEPEIVRLEFGRRYLSD